MKRIITAISLTLFAATAVIAAGPESVTLPAKNGNVTFPHKKHQEIKLEKGCTACHEQAAGGKIAGLGKDWAHKTCKGCHSAMNKGPTKCGECHKK
ncbi:MAG: cytochrome c3 family protein [Desulfuromonadia bacterium]